MISLVDTSVFLARWSLIGVVIFSGFVVFVFRSGLVYASRKPDGTLKERVPTLGLLVMGGFLLAVMGFFLLATYWGLVGQGHTLGFGGYFGLNFLLYFILFLFDTLVIDTLVLGVWRPGFLRLADEMGRESMDEHIRRSLPVGLVLGLLLAGIVAWIATTFFSS